MTKVINKKIMITIPTDLLKEDMLIMKLKKTYLDWREILIDHNRMQTW